MQFRIENLKLGIRDHAFPIPDSQFPISGFGRRREQHEPPSIHAARRGAAIEAAPSFRDEALERKAFTDEPPLEIGLIAHALDHVVEGMRIGRGVGTMDVEHHPGIAPSRGADDAD